MAEREKQMRQTVDLLVVFCWRCVSDSDQKKKGWWTGSANLVRKGRERAPQSTCLTLPALPHQHLPHSRVPSPP